MATRIKTFPHFTINVLDKSIYRPIYEEILPLHRPIFFMRAAKGRVNVPVWCYNFNDAVKEFGDETFDEYSKYFSREALFVKRCMMKHGCFIVRLADDKANFASAVIEAVVELDAEVVQYVLDNNGDRVLDEYGNPIPRLDSSNNVVKELGMKVNFRNRSFLAGEDINNLKPYSVRLNGKEHRVIPLIAFKSESPSKLYNNTGFKLFHNPNDYDDAVIDQLKTLFYTFMPVEKPYKSDTVQPLRDFYSYTFTTFTLKPDQVNYAVDKRVSIEDILATNYRDNDDNNLLPYEIYSYSKSINELCKLVQKYEGDYDFDVAHDEWMANILTLRNRSDQPYTHVVQETTVEGSIIFDENYIIYLKDGSDGSLEDEIMEDLQRQYMRGTIYPEIMDKAKYPFTHMYDTGVSLPTKYAMIEMLSYRDDMKIVLSTQDANRKLNDKSEDQSCGAALRARCFLQPESVIFGTGCCRADIAQQAGTLINSSYKDIVPLTYEMLDKRSEFQGTSSVTGQFKGLPNSNINLIKGFWTPCSDDHKQRSWDTGLNYAQHYDMRRTHYPDIHTVYYYHTSVLSDTTFTDCVVYAKHIIRRVWATYVGLHLASSELHRLIENDLNDRMYAMCGNMFPAKARAWQTAEEQRIGYITHVTLDMQGYGVNRVWEVDVVCSRENYSMA